jgi:uncharacterized protein YeaO (DUF488 family)
MSENPTSEVATEWATTAMAGQGKIGVARVYAAPEPGQGSRILVDRLWPRGLSKEAAGLDEWCKTIAPSDELRSPSGLRRWS